MRAIKSPRSIWGHELRNTSVKRCHSAQSAAASQSVMAWVPPTDCARDAELILEFRRDACCLWGIFFSKEVWGFSRTVPHLILHSLRQHGLTDLLWACLLLKNYGTLWRLNSKTCWAAEILYSASVDTASSPKTSMINILSFWVIGKV